VACLAVGLIAAAVPRDAQATPRGHAALNGEEIFRGVVFGQGPVAKMVSSERVRSLNAAVAKMSAKQILMITAAQDTIVARMRQSDPAFFTRYARDMQSGNPVLIRKALDETRALLDKVFEDVRQAPHMDDTQRGCLLLVFAIGVVVINVAAAVNIDIAANAVTVANVATYKNAVCVSEELSAEADNALLRDQFVRDLALRLAL
jgi:SdpC family antimicrobial peptide